MTKSVECLGEIYLTNNTGGPNKNIDYAFSKNFNSEPKIYNTDY
jgi:hypothetical protein